MLPEGSPWCFFVVFWVLVINYNYIITFVFWKMRTKQAYSLNTCTWVLCFVCLYLHVSGQDSSVCKNRYQFGIVYIKD